LVSTGASRSPESRAYEWVAQALAGTPGRLRVYGAIAVVACVVFGGIGFLTVRHLDNELADARHDAEQLVRIQTIRTNLVKADANATNAFLVGGLEPTETRAAYTDAIEAASATIAEASNANDDDVDALAEVNQALTAYTGLIESARANNRQGFPVGTAYLRTASASLQSAALPPLEKLVADGVERANASSSASDARAALLRLTGTVLVVLIAIQLWLFRRTHRVLNQPLAAATVVVAALGLIAVAVVAWSDNAESDARAGPYARTVALATSRISAFDAKSAESLTLIARGSGAAYETRFQTVSTTATRSLESITADDAEVRETSNALGAYIAAHRNVRSMDDKGDYDGAVKLATGAGAANEAFAQFDAVSAATLENRARELSDDLDRARLPLIPLSWLLLAVGLLAGFAASRGIARRLQEYR
jgi:hypothetical protein